jgi:hypothetical protein
MQRSFLDLSATDIADIEKAAFFARGDFRGAVRWDDLLKSQRVLIVSEAGAGKTYECQEQQKRLWNAGEPAFFLDLATLANSSVRDMLTAKQEARLDQWLRSQSEVATFFLDSIDELKLTLGKFDQALIRLTKALGGQLGRVRVVITTRPVPIDRALIGEHLPIPEVSEAEPTAEGFADAVMDRKKKKSDAPDVKLWRQVGLLPLSTAEMREFAVGQNVTDPDVLLEDIQRRDAEEFAQRPQDLIELCADWRDHHRIRTHREQVETNVATKLKPSTERKERAELSQDKAIEIASRLALAAMLTRRLTLRHNAEADAVEATEAALDPLKILPDVGAEEIATLLERPLFGFASYGRVRFHHQSVVEYLAARRLEALLARGVSVKAIKRLLFAETAQQTRTVRPSMRPVAAWLAISNGSIFNDIVAVDPSVVLDHGDPQSLSPPKRAKALEAYVKRYGKGGWRGLSTPRIQVHRFASPELASSVTGLWNNQIENPEVRRLLLQMIGAGKIEAAADIAYDVTMDQGSEWHERSFALRSLIQLQDARLESIAQSLETDAARWCDKVARQAMLEFFPAFLPVPRFLKILDRIKEQPRAVGELTFHLPRAIENDKFSKEYLDELREGLFGKLVEGATWERDKFPNHRTKRPDLMPAHLAACRRQWAERVRTPQWVKSSMLAVRLCKDGYSERESLKDLRRALAELSPEEREAAFWAEDEFVGRLRPPTEAFHRVYDLSHHGGIQLDSQDASWVRKRLSDPKEPLDRREMMLRAEINLLPRSEDNFVKFLESLKPFVSDAPSLVSFIEMQQRPQPGSDEYQKLVAENEEHRQKVQRAAAEAHASWVGFWQEIVQTPDVVFAQDRAENTAWNLWDAVARSGDESRASGWNRRFIERQFGKEVADRLRQTMMAMWRKGRPTLRSERSPEAKNRFLVKWQFGLAAIYAEAEAPAWAEKLSESEAKLACRYAPLELNGFPSWLDGLAAEHPTAVDRTLCQELTLSLQEKEENAYSLFLQNVRHASPTVAAVFVPCIRQWLSEVAKVNAEPNEKASEQNLRQAMEILRKSGNSGDRDYLAAIATERLKGGLGVPFASVWLPTLLRLRPEAGVEVLETGLKGSAVSRLGAGAQWIARLFEAPGYRAPVLLRLLRAAYEHVHVSHDANHGSGVHEVDERDRAERGRNAVLNALLATTGSEGWAAKLEMANDPLFAHFKDRAIALAEEKAAEEADNVPLKESEFLVLDKSGEAPPATTEAMFALMRDRLDDLDDLLLQDESPREAWAIIKDEHIMRREIARALKDAAKGTYIVDQESVTADEKETDIRLRSTSSDEIGTIELKLGDGRPGKDLFNTLKDQLLLKYMAPLKSHAGCLLVTIAREREWENPKTGKLIGFDELIAVLNEEAGRLSHELGGEVKIMAKGLNLVPRLKTEKEVRAKKKDG